MAATGRVREPPAKSCRFPPRAQKPAIPAIRHSFVFQINHVQICHIPLFRQMNQILEANPINGDFPWPRKIWPCKTASNSRKSQRDNKLGFPILSDTKSEVAHAFGIRFALPDYLVELYKGFGSDLAVLNDDPAWVLPMPARYVIGTDGVIAYSEVNPDYTQRPDPSELLPVLDRLKASKAA